MNPSRAARTGSIGMTGPIHAGNIEQARGLARSRVDRAIHVTGTVLVRDETAGNVIALGRHAVRVPPVRISTALRLDAAMRLWSEWGGS